MKFTKKVRRTGIRTRLLTTFLVTVTVPLLLFGWFMFFASSGSLETEVSHTYAQTVKQIAVSFSEYVSRTDQTNRIADSAYPLQRWMRNRVTSNVSDHTGLRELEKNAISSLKQFAQTNTDIFSLSVVSLDGETISYVAGKLDRTENDFFSEYYEPLHRSTGDVVLLPATTASYTFTADTPVFTVGYKYLDTVVEHAEDKQLNTYIGYLIAECPITYLETLCNSIDLGSGSNLYFLDGEKGIVYTTEASEPHRRDIQTVTKGGLVSGRTKIAGSDFYLLETTIPNTDWTILASIPYELLTTRSDSLLATFVLLCIVSVILVALVSFWVSGSFTRPILRLRDAMKKVGNGDLSVRVQVDRNDELGDLTDGFNHLTKRVDNLLGNITEAQEREVFAKYQMLQSQIHPHFLYNTLDTIRMMAVLEDKPDIAEALLSLSNLFRYHVRESSKIVTIEEELIQVRNYLSLQKLRHQDKLTIEYDIDPDTLSCRMPKILLQPLLENAFAHGFSNLEKDGVLSIRITKEGDLVRFTVHDNGQGMNEAKLKEQRKRLSEPTAAENSIGLANVNERLRLYFSEAHTLKLDSAEGVGTTVSFTIPMLAESTALFRYEERHTDREKEETGHE